MGALQNILKFGKSIVDNIEGNNNGGVPSPVVTQNKNIPQAPIRIAQPQAMPQFNNMNVQPLMTPQMIQRFQPAPINDNNFISRNIINPVVNDVESIYHPIAAGLAGVGGLVRIGGNALIGNQQAEQRAIQQTNQAIANQLNNPKSGLTYKDATSGNAGQFAKSFAKEGIRLSTYVAAPGVGKVAENAVAPSLLSRAGKGALQFGALNAGSTAAQEGLDGHINPTDVAKSFGMGAAFGGGLPILHDVAGSVGKSIIGDIKPVEAQTPEMAMNHLNDQFNQLDNQRTNMINQGLDDNHPDMVNNFKQMTDVYNQQEALANQHLQPTPPVAPQVGKTETLYHGTPNKFDKFDTNRMEGGAAWFTNNKDEILSGEAGAVQAAGQKLNIMERQVKPGIKLADDILDEKLTTDQLIQDGYRGVKYEGENGIQWTKLFFPNEDTIPVKSAKSTPAPQVGKTEPITLYHGSNNKFDTFDMAKSGTGEGADLYGKGAYLTDNKDLADFYAKAVSKKDFVDRYTMDGPLGTENPVYKPNADNLAAKKAVVNEFIANNLKIFDVSTQKVDESLIRAIAKDLESRGFSKTDAIAEVTRKLEYARKNGNSINGYRGELDYLVKQFPETGELVSTELKKRGYDGLSYASDKAYEGAGGKNFVIYNPDKLKGSAPQVETPKPFKIANPNKMSEEEFAAYTNTPEGQMPFRPNEIKNNDSIRIRNPQAEAKILESLQNGETTDRILYDYMQTTGANMDTAVRDVDRVMRESGNQSIKSNPLRGTVALPEATDVGQAHLNADLVTGQLNDARNIAKEAVANLNSHDLSLIKNIETKPVEIIAQSARNPEEFLKTVTKLRDYYDLRDAWDQYLGVDHGYRMNYLRQLVKQAETDIKQEPVRVGGGNKRVGYTNARSYQTLNTNVMDALDRESGATHNLGKLAYEKGLEHLYGNKISKGELRRGETGFYESLKTKYGKGLAASPEVAQELNSRAVPNKTGKVLNAYDKANAGIKYLKLGGGLFHGTTEAMNFLGQQLTSLETYKNPIEAARASARVISSTVNAAKAEEAFTYFKEVKPGETISTMDKARLGGVTIYPKEILADVNVSLVDNLKSSNPIKMLHDAVFQREIPIQKLTIFEQATKGLNPSIPADLAKIREAANAVNHIFGGLNRAVDTHVLSPNNSKTLSRFLLATDFTEAKINTMRDALTRKGTQGNIARQAVLGKTLVAAAPGLIAYTALGQIDWSNPKDVVKHVIDQILDPHVPTSFNTKSGINKIAKTPETFISEFGRLITPLFADGPDKKGNELTAIQHYLTGRLAALPSTALQLGSNKDYFGNPVIERNSDGSLKIGQSARNLALQVAPIPVVQANTVYKTQRETPGNTTSFANSVLEAASNIAGFRTKADPNDPKMKSLNFQNQVVNGLSKQDKNAWNTVHGKVYDEYGNLKTTVTPADLLNKYTTELSNPTVLAADKKINDYKKLQGQPSDPFYDLTPEQQRTLLIIKTLKNVDRGDNAGTAKIMTERNQGWIDQYYKDSSTYYDKLNLPPSTKTRLIENPSVSPEVQKALDESKGLAGQDYYNYVIQHPELTEYYSNLDSVIRQQRDYYNEPQFKGYPVASDRVSQLLDASRSMAKSPERSAIFKDPEVSNFLADVAMWQLNQGASKARFEGQDYTQKDLKNIYSVGNYDIAKLANGQYAQTAGTLSDGTKLAGNGFTTGGSAGFTLGTAPAAGGYTKKPKVRKARKMYIKRNKVRMKNTHPKIRYTMPQQKPLKIQYGRTVEPIKIKM